MKRNPASLRLFLQSGGLAAYVAAATLVIGFALYLTLWDSSGYGRLEFPPAQQVATLIAYQGLLHAWYLIIYVLFGLALLMVSLVLDETLKRHVSFLRRLATALGLIWSGLVIATGMVANAGAAAIVAAYPIAPEQAIDAWLPLHFVINGLGGGNEIVGGLWVALISWAGLASPMIPRRIGTLGLFVGLSGVVTVFPCSELFAAIFGFGLIAWFMLIGKIAAPAQFSVTDVRCHSPHHGQT